MIKISKAERNALESVGLLHFHQKLKGGGFDDANIAIVNKHHKSRHKQYYIAETFEILAFLEHFEDLPLQALKPTQLQALLDAKLIKPSQIQHAGEYVPNATVFITSTNKILCKKIPAYLTLVGIWKK